LLCYMSISLCTYHILVLQTSLNFIKSSLSIVAYVFSQHMNIIIISFLILKLSQCHTCFHSVSAAAIHFMTLIGKGHSYVITTDFVVCFLTYWYHHSPLSVCW
jgi:hypothetical protein